VRANYKKLEDCSWVTVEADGTMDEVHDDLYQIITAEVSSVIQLFSYI
jgi:thymidylate kinase